MKAKLIRRDNGEFYLIDENNKITSHHHLSKQNCDEIFGVVDVERLANETFTETNLSLKEYEEGLHIGFKIGFNKAMELNKDKLFTLEDVKKAYMDGVSNGHNFGYPAIDHTDKYIQSLQQPTKIEVEIEMVFLGFEMESGVKMEEPKLDSDECLILKKI
jgi:hypothetical protein